MKIFAGKARLDGPLCLYDENGDPIALISERRKDAEKIALAIVKAVNEAGGIEIEDLQQATN